MKQLTVKEVISAVNGSLEEGPKDRLITGVSTDTRTLEKGDLFFALTGETDGHNYIQKAYEKDCAAVVVSKKVPVRQGVPVILVEDTLKALQTLAGYYLSQFSLKKIAVTGSTGKTTTKELLYTLLSAKYKTVKNKGNFNNHIGLPLTAFTVEEFHEAGIFEMGMSGLGEIHLMAGIVHPHAAVITNVGLSHIEKLGSRENILKAKMEVTDYFSDEALLVINDDNDLLHTISRKEKRYTIIPVGKREGLADRILSVEENGSQGILLHMEIEGKRESFSLPVPGIHNGYNAAQAIAVARRLGVEPKLCAEALRNFKNTDKRLSVKETQAHIRIIDDTYNASPDSMKAAISVLKAAEGRRRIAVLGDMFEMGELAEDFHTQIGMFAASQGIDILMTTGENAAYICRGAEPLMGSGRCRHFTQKEDLMKELEQILKPEDTVLVKGSRGMHMEEIVEFIQKNRS